MNLIVILIFIFFTIKLLLWFILMIISFRVIISISAVIQINFLIIICIAMSSIVNRSMFLFFKVNSLCSTTAVQATRRIVIGIGAVIWLIIWVTSTHSRPRIRIPLWVILMTMAMMVMIRAKSVSAISGLVRRVCEVVWRKILTVHVLICTCNKDQHK